VGVGRPDLDWSMVLDEGVILIQVWRRKLERLIFGEFSKILEVLCRKRLQIDPETSNRYITKTPCGFSSPRWLTREKSKSDEKRVWHVPIEAYKTTCDVECSTVASTAVELTTAAVMTSS
jgi:hypothetical protein